MLLYFVIYAAAAAASVENLLLLEVMHCVRLNLLTFNLTCESDKTNCISFATSRHIDLHLYV